MRDFVVSLAGDTEEQGALEHREAGQDEVWVLCGDIAEPVLEVSEKERRGAMQESAGRATWSLTVFSPAFRNKMSQDRRK